MSALGRGGVQNAVGAYDTPPALAHAVLAHVVAEMLDPERAHRDAPLAWRGPWPLTGRILEPSVGSGNWMRALRIDEVPTVPSDTAITVEAMDVDPFAPGLELVRQAGGTAGAGHYRNTVFRATCDLLEARRVPTDLQLAAVVGFLSNDPEATPDWVVGNVPYSITHTDTCPRCDGTGHRGGKTRGPPCSACDTGTRDGTGRRAGTGERTRRVDVAELHLRRALEVTRRHVVMVLRSGILGSALRRPFWHDNRPRTVWMIRPRPSFSDGGGDNAEYAAIWWDRQHVGATRFDWLDWR